MTALPNRAVATAWAQGTAESGRSHNKQFYFKGACLYSYGPHYLAGWIIPAHLLSPAPAFPWPLKLVLVNATKFSMTTTRHVGIARTEAARIVPEPVVLSVPDLTDVFREVQSLERADRGANLAEGFRRILATTFERNGQAISGDVALILNQ